MQFFKKYCKTTTNTLYYKRITTNGSNELRCSPKETMKLCQTLYEGGYITYMRTDCAVYSEEFIKKASDYIDKVYGKEYINVDMKAGGQKDEKLDKKVVKKSKKRMKKIM